MKRISLCLCFVAVAATARAQEPPPADGRYDELLARQHQLEAQLQAQQRLLDTLQRTVALPTDAPPPRSRFQITPDTGPAELQAPLAGYSWKNFFLRDRHSWFVLVPKGRINVDWYNFLNRPSPPAGVEANSAGDPRSSLRDTIFLRRARIGLAGTIARVIDFRVEAELASLAQPGQYATLADASAVINFWPYVRLEAGQFYIPFTLENQTSENFTDFMDKSTVVRFAVPSARDTGGMLFGEAPRDVVRYWFGVFNGDGQNTKNLDNQPAFIGRLVVAPLAFLNRVGPVHEFWLGGSFWYQRSDNLGGPGPPSTSGATAGDLPGLSTEGGFSIFSSNYGNGTDAMKNAIRSHLAQNGNTSKYAFELNLPIWKRFGLRSEYTHQAIDLREYNDLNPGNGNLTRTEGAFAHLDGWGAYVEAYLWLGGDINPDKPGLYSLPHWNGYIPPKRPEWAVLLAAKYEHVELDIGGLPYSINSMGSSVPDPATGHYGLDTFALGASFWVTRHSRLMANYNLNYVGMGDPGQAAALEKKNLFFQKLEHELLFRLQVNL